MHLTDSHCHLDSYDDLPAILARARNAGIGTLLAIGIGDGPETMHRALDIAHQYDWIYASAGIHPQEAASATSNALARLRTLAEDPRCIAIGEIGLDYYHVANPDILTQQAAFIAQLAIAAAVHKPILVHCRTSELAQPDAKQKFGDADAWEDLLAILAEHWSVEGAGANGGIMHCFSGNPDQARRSLDVNFHLSFAGNLTYPRSTGLREVAAFAPADRILLETDAPFLAPIPHRGKQNEPALMTYTASYLADLRGIPLKQLAALTTKNFQRLFPSTT